MELLIDGVFIVFAVRLPQFGFEGNYFIIFHFQLHGHDNQAWRDAMQTNFI